MLIFNSFQLRYLSAFSQDCHFPRLEKSQISFPNLDADANQMPQHPLPKASPKRHDEANDSSQVGPRFTPVLVDSHFDIAKHMYKFPLHIIQSLAVSKGERPVYGLLT